jgi:hydroxypyruvate reductase
MTESRLRGLLLEIFAAALQAVHGRARVHAALAGDVPDAPVYVIALGKAAVPMAQGALDVLGGRIAAALVVTKDAGGIELPWPVLEAGHPRPDERSLDAGRRLLEFVGRLPQAARVLVLLSGGASALVEHLPPGVTLADLRRVTDWLLASGLDITAMNRIRKRLSLVKGGRLAVRLAGRETRCLAISDVPGDDPRAIGSGPLTAEGGGEEPRGLPEFVRALLARAPPLPQANDPCFRTVRYEIIARLEDARRAAAQAARRRGVEAMLEGEFVSGEAAQAGERLAGRLLAAPPGVLHVWGGETTVVLPENPGRGGRNQNLALAAARALSGRDAVALLAAGTDGSDGPTGDAGALVDGGTVARGEAQGFDARAALARADAGTFLEASGDLVHTGPTGTNVMDLVLGMRME